MCGIIGYCGKKQARNILIDGLYSLEYRGYDSSGVSFLKDDEILTYKCIGRVLNLDKICPSNIDSVCGIGHTRWATHGPPSKLNAHPHISSTCAVVHNGIIENYIELKKELVDLGYVFVSDTDSECIAHLADFYFKETGSALDSVIKVKNRLCGSYAFAIIFKESVNSIWACKKDNPFIVAKSQDGIFISSDINVLIKYSSDVFIPNDGDIICIDEDLKVFNTKKENLKFKYKKISYNLDGADKGKFKHYMLKEISEQPSIIKNLVSEILNDDGIPDFYEFGLTDDILRSFDSVHIIACGSAMHSGLVGRYWIEKMVGIPVFVTTASEYIYGTQISVGNTLYIAVSQSGETADTISALRMAKTNGHKTLAIVNKEGSVISREADYVLYTKAGPEIAVATTKGYTSQLTVLYLIAAKLALIKNKNDFFNIKKQCYLLCHEVPDKMMSVISQRENISKIANRIFDKSDMYYIGRGIDYNVCVEASLKLKEISYVHSEAYAAGELKHGTLSLIEKNTPVIAFCTEKSLCNKIVSNIKEVSSRGGFVIFVGYHFIENHSECSDDIFVLPEIEEIFSPFVTSVFSQIFAYEIALLRGCDIDHPRNLAKSVTVE